MGNEERSMDILTRSDLEQLKALALREHENFFERNPHLKNAYHHSLIGIFLCQGAACHYLDQKTGVKDYDIWHFYIKNSKVNFPYRRHKIVERGYKGKTIDFLKRAIPKDLYDSCEGKAEQTVMMYLHEKNTDTKRHLLKKAIIGLYPDSLFFRVLWKGV